MEAVAAGIVPYYRVSTQGQGQSGLGLEAQESCVSAYAKRTGSTMLQSFTEIESGKNCERVVLAAAMAYARKHKATLVIAKLDRLSRTVAFSKAAKRGSSAA